MPFALDPGAPLPRALGRDRGDHAELLHFFDRSVDMLCIANLEGYFIRLNAGWTGALGWSLGDLKARPFQEFVHPDDRAATLAEVERLGRGERTIRFENRYRCSDGSYRWLQWNATYLPEYQRIYAIARDVTAQRSLEAEVLAATDREQERLGLELHDGLCQTLAGIAAYGATLARALAAHSKAEAAAAGEIEIMINQATKQARDQARAYAPIHLREVGLATALRGLGSNLEALFQVHCTLYCDDPARRLGVEAEAHLFRIAQHAVSNAVMHGGAKNIEMSLTFSGRRGALSIRDDGVGIPETAPAGPGIGLHSMAYRARVIGASLLVRDRVPRGTEVLCEFSLPTDERGVSGL